VNGIVSEKLKDRFRLRKSAAGGLERKWLKFWLSSQSRLCLRLPKSDLNGVEFRQMFKKVDKEFGCVKIILWPFTILREIRADINEIVRTVVYVVFGFFVFVPLWIALLPIRFVMVVLNHPPKPNGFIRGVSKKVEKWWENVGDVLMIFAGYDG